MCGRGYNVPTSPKPPRAPPAPPRLLVAAAPLPAASCCCLLATDGVHPHARRLKSSQVKSSQVKSSQVNGVKSSQSSQANVSRVKSSRLEQNPVQCSAVQSTITCVYGTKSTTAVPLTTPAPRRGGQEQRSREQRSAPASTVEGGGIRRWRGRHVTWLHPLTVTD